MRSICLVASLAASLAAQGLAPIEYGTIRWRTGYALARAEAKAAGLPLLVLFQEVPG